jgi:hypothetical protein
MFKKKNRKAYLVPSQVWIKMSTDSLKNRTKNSPNKKLTSEYYL